MGQTPDGGTSGPLDAGTSGPFDAASTLCVNLVRGSFRCQPGFAAAEGE
ncbi:hypothetical protein ACFUOZ_19330 [Paenarthrobacter sp. NPDC057355]